MKRWLTENSMHFYTAAALLALGVYAWSGIYTRHWADDYCYSGSLRQEGFWTSQLNAYRLTSDRYSVMPVSSLSDFFGPLAIRVWPGLAALLWLAALAWVFARLRTRGFDKAAAWLLPAHLLLFSLLSAPNLFQVFYWRTGMLTYFMPLVLLTCLAALLIQPHPGPNSAINHAPTRRFSPARAGLLLLAFIVGGFSETTAALQTTALILALAAVALFWHSPLKNHSLADLAAALLGALLAMLALFLSPAAHLRQAHFATPPGLLALLQMTLQFAFDFIVQTLRGLPLPSLMTVAAPFLLAMRKPAAAQHESPRQNLSAILLVWVAAYWLVAACFAPSVYAESAYAEPRAQFPAIFVLICALSASGWLLGRLAAAWLGRPALRAAALVLLVIISLYPLRAAAQTYASIPAMRQRAALWDARDKTIRSEIAAGVTDLSIPALDSVAGLSELSPDPTYFVNLCSANYYGLKSIRAR